MSAQLAPPLAAIVAAWTARRDARARVTSARAAHEAAVAALIAAQTDVDAAERALAAALAGDDNEIPVAPPLTAGDGLGASDDVRTSSAALHAAGGVGPEIPAPVSDPASLGGVGARVADVDGDVWRHAAGGVRPEIPALPDRPEIVAVAPSGADNDGPQAAAPSPPPSTPPAATGAGGPHAPAPVDPSKMRAEPPSAETLRLSGQKRDLYVMVRAGPISSERLCASVFSHLPADKRLSNLFAALPKLRAILAPFGWALVNDGAVYRLHPLADAPRFKPPGRPAGPPASFSTPPPASVERHVAPRSPDVFPERGARDFTPPPRAPERTKSKGVSPEERAAIDAALAQGKATRFAPGAAFGSHDPGLRSAPLQLVRAEGETPIPPPPPPEPKGRW